jgi:flagellin
VVNSASMSSLLLRHAFARQQADISKAVERLATGKRINRASDDPSGAIAVAHLSARKVALDQTIKEADLAGKVLDTADGALGEIGSQLIELNSLVVTSANTAGLTAAERAANQLQADSILQSIQQTIATTEFDGKKLLTGEGGYSSGGTYYVLGDVNLTPTHILDLANGKTLNLESGDLEAAQKAVKAAQDLVNGRRAQIGAYQKNTLRPTADSARIELAGTAAVQSTIEDADVAKETSNLIRAQILQQASLAAIHIAEQSASGAVGALLGA